MGEGAPPAQCKHFSADIRGWWMGEVVVDCDAMSDCGFYMQAGKDAQILVSLFSKSSTLSFRIPLVCCERE